MANDSLLRVTLTADARPLTGVLRDSAQALDTFAGDAERSGQRFAAAMADSDRALETVNGHLQRLEGLGRAAGGQLAALGRAGVGALRDQARQLAETESLAQALGLSATRLQEWQYAGQQVGLEASQVGEIFTRLQTTLGELGAGGDGAAAGVFAQLNLDLRELQSLDPDAQLQQITEAIARLDDPAQRTHAFETLAEGASRLNPLLQAGGLRLRTYSEEARTLGVALSGLELADAAEADRALRQVGAAVEGLGNQLLVALGPGLAATADGLSGLIRDAGGARALFDDLVTTGEVLASLYAGHLAQSLATYATTALAANGASLTLTGTLRALRGVMATAFGPLGVVVAAAGVLYTFREELGLVDTVSENATQALKLNKQAIEQGSKAALDNSYDALTSSLQAVSLQTQETILQLQELHTRKGFYEKSHGGVADSINGEIGTQQALLKRLGEEQIRLQAAMEDNRERRKALAEDTHIFSDSTAKLGDSTDAAAQAARNQADALQALQDRLDPAAKSQRDYLADQITLQTAWVSGQLKIDQYLTAVGQLPKLYQNSGDAAQTYGLDASRAAKTATQETSVLSRTLDQMVAGLDDTFQGFWQRLLGGAKTSFEGLKTQAISALAEIIHAYTTKRIVASLGLSVGGSLAGTGSALASGTGGGFGGSGLDLASLGKTLYQGITDGFGAIQWTGVPTGATAYTSGFGSQVATGGGMFGGSFQNFTGFNGMASLAAAYAGTQVGNKLGSSLFGKQANSNLGATIGGGVGTFFGGSLGAFAGSTLGGMVDSLFGSHRDYKARFEGWATTPERHFGAGGTPYYSSGHYRNGDLGRGRETAFGSFGFTRKTKFEPSDMIDLLDALAALDQTLASGASAEQIETVRDALDGWSTQLHNDSLGKIITRRYAVITQALAQSASEVTASLIDRVGVINAKTAEKAVPQLAQALQLGNLIDGLGDSVRHYAVGVVSDTRRSMEEALAQITAGVAAHAAVSAISDQLNLTFDNMGDRAVEAALNLQQLAGGLDALQSQAQRYYANFFSESERQQRAIAQLTPTLHRAGLSAYSTREQFRAVVESLDLNSAAGRQTYSELMGIADAFAAISDPIQATNQSLQDLQAAAQSQVETAKDAVRRAYQTFASQAFDQRITLLELAGREQAALSLQRQQELETLDASLRPIQQRIWALQDEQQALAAARQASDDYRRALAQASSQLAQTLGSIGVWVDQQQASGGAPGPNLQAAQAQFARQLVKAQSGDRDALGGLTQYAERYQQAGAAYYGSGSGYQRIRGEIVAALDALPDQVSAEQYVAAEIKAALASAVDQLPGGIASALDPLFAALDTNLDGLLTFGELQTGLQGIASDAQIRSLIQQLDSDGDGQISALEAIKGATDRVDGNTGTLESRALDQLRQLTGLSAEMSRTTDQFITLNTTMQSLQEALVALGLAQQQAAEIEARRRAAEAAEKQRIAQERARTLAEQRKTLQGEIRSLQATYDGYQKVIAFNRDPNATGSSIRGGLAEHYKYHKNVRRGASSLNDLLSGDYDYRYRPGLPTSKRVRELLKGYNEAVQNSDSVAQQLTLLKQSLDRLPTYNIGGAFGGAEIITQPTLFNTALMGEAGPEAIMPLSRGADGSLGVRLDGAPAPVGGGGNRESAELAPLLERLARLTAENTELLRRIEAHEGAGVRVAQAGHQRSIDQLTRIADSNQALDDRARLEALA